MDNYLCQNTIDMQNLLNTTDTNTPESVKKVWATPVFEIISKEIIKSGLVAGAEGWSGTAYLS
jgi:hypothetical protein